MSNLLLMYQLRVIRCTPLHVVVTTFCFCEKSLTPKVVGSGSEYFSVLLTDTLLILGGDDPFIWENFGFIL